MRVKISSPESRLERDCALGAILKATARVCVVCVGDAGGRCVGHSSGRGVARAGTRRCVASRPPLLLPGREKGEFVRVLDAAPVRATPSSEARARETREEETARRPTGPRRVGVVKQKHAPRPLAALCVQRTHTPNSEATAGAPADLTHTRLPRAGVVSEIPLPPRPFFLQHAAPRAWRWRRPGRRRRQRQRRRWWRCQHNLPVRRGDKQAPRVSGPAPAAGRAGPARSGGRPARGGGEGEGEGGRGRVGVRARSTRCSVRFSFLFGRRVGDGQPCP